MGKFAANTRVPVAQSEGEIHAVLGRFGGRVLNVNKDVPGRAIIMIQSNHATPRILRIVLNFPIGPGKHVAQTCRRRWRALVGSIKQRLVDIDEGIQTFDQAFMAWIVGPDGKTLYEKAQELRLLSSPEAA